MTMESKLARVDDVCQSYAGKTNHSVRALLFDEFDDNAGVT